MKRAKKMQQEYRYYRTHKNSKVELIHEFFRYSIYIYIYISYFICFYIYKQTK